VTSSSTATSSSIVSTSITITGVTGTSGAVTVKGILKDASGNGLQGLQLTVTVDGGYTGRVITGRGGNFAYAGLGPKKGTHVVTVSFVKTAQYAASSASKSYSL
jgi:multidrug efflux pump subunit AcrA (membrane-fusion protein)